MTFILAAALTAAGLVGQPKPQMMRVPEVSADIEALHGQVVDIRGWLGECGNLSCGLFPTLQSAQGRQYGDHMLSIGSGNAFDRQASAFRFRPVILRARVNASCRTRYVCTDRANELEPLGIRSARGTAAAPRTSSGE